MIVYFEAKVKNNLSLFKDRFTSIASQSIV